MEETHAVPSARKRNMVTVQKEGLKKKFLPEKQIGDAEGGNGAV